MRTPFRFSFLLALLVSGSAFAHDTIPGDWCPAGTVVKIVGTFSYTPEQLRAYRDKQLAGADCDANSPAKTCGIIDDWYWAHEMASGGCGGMGLKMKQPAEAIPFVESPSEFNAVNHHDVYDFTDGLLQGPCAICISNTPPPPLEITRKN